MSKFFEKFIAFIALLLGITILILAIVSTKMDKEYSKWIETKATIQNKVSLSETSNLYKYKISYTIDDKDYIKELKLTEDYQIEQVITIKYNPNNKEEITTELDKLGSPAEYIIAIILFIFSGYMFFIGIDKIKEGV